MTDFPQAGLERFSSAQDGESDGYRTALTELRTTGKRSHWIWYIFPQLDGLGHSSTARHYALHGIAEAEAYLRDPVLAQRLAEITEVVAERLREGTRLVDLMGSQIDALKLVSSMTLFSPVAQRAAIAGPGSNAHRIAHAAAEVLSLARTQGFTPCEHTLSRLKT